MTVKNTVRHFTAVDDRTNDEYKKLWEMTAKIKEMLGNQHSRKILKEIAHGLRVSMMFWENSTRTSGSFEKAAQNLGASVYDFAIAGSSVAKGETLGDTARMVAADAQAFIVRHNEKGTTKALSEILGIPSINAGEGTGEHPTQALLDMFTLWEQFDGALDGKTIAYYGDLARGRTCHSLIQLAARFNMHAICVAPDEDMKMPQEYIDYALEKGTNVKIVSDIEDVIGDVDAVYVTRLQRERIKAKKRDGTEQDKIFQDSGYKLIPEHMNMMRENAIVMHPLPRVDELPEECDSDHRAKYFHQADNGIPVRMALLITMMNLDLNYQTACRLHDAPKLVRPFLREWQKLMA